MRLVTRKLWRAFPELDRFGDEQCVRFVRAAASGIVSRAVRWGLVALAVVVGLVLIPGLAMLEEYCVSKGWWTTVWGERLIGRPRWMAEIVHLGLLLVAVLGAGAFLGAVTRDVLLRLRVRRVLRTRGRCAQCTYFLGGLPVNVALQVVCPECGFVTEVDRSLGELSGGEGGAAVFAPSDELIRTSEPWLTGKRLWKWTKRGAVVSGVLVVIAGAGWGWHEWRMFKQAERARALKPGATGLMDLTLAAQTTGAPEDAANAFGLFASLVKKMTLVQAETFPQEMQRREDGIYLYAGGEWIAARAYPGESAQAPKERELNEPHSLKVLEAFEKQGVFADMRVMVDAPLAVMVILQQQDQPLITVVLADYGKIRSMARWNAGRMRLAVRNDDPERFAESLDLTLGLVRMLEKQPVLIGRLVSLAIEALAYGEVRGVLHERRDARWIDACERVLKKYADHGKRSLPFEGERVSAKDTVCWVFSDTARTRLGKYSPEFNRVMQGWMSTASLKGRLGGLEENLAVIDDWYAALIKASGEARSKRAPLVPPVTDLLLVNLLVPGSERALRSLDQIEIDRVASILLVALERYRLEKGEYPATLAEFDERYKMEWGGAFPIDPWSGKPFCYKRIDATKDEQGRGFILYTAGQDGVDDGGVSGNDPRDALSIGGVDYIINDVKR